MLSGKTKESVRSNIETFEPLSNLHIQNGILNAENLRLCRPPSKPSTINHYRWQNHKWIMNFPTQLRRASQLNQAKNWICKVLKRHWSGELNHFLSIKFSKNRFWIEGKGIFSVFFFCFAWFNHSVLCMKPEYKSILNQITSLSASVIQVNFYTHRHTDTHTQSQYQIENLPHKCAYFVTKRYHSNSVRRAAKTEAAKISISLHWISDFVEIQCTINDIVTHNTKLFFALFLVVFGATGTIQRKRNEKTTKTQRKRERNWNCFQLSDSAFDERWLILIISFSHFNVQCPAINRNLFAIVCDSCQWWTLYSVAGHECEHFVELIYY